MRNARIVGKRFPLNNVLFFFYAEQRIISIVNIAEEQCILQEKQYLLYIVLEAVFL